MGLSELAAEIRAFRFDHLPGSIGVPGRGSKTPEFLFIGDASGQSENEQVRPFAGLAGNLLQKWINHWNLSKEKYAITNVMKVWPRTPENETRAPTAEEIEACSRFLEEEIKLLKPKMLVVLGAVSAKEVAGLEQGIMKNAGSLTVSKEKFGSLPTLILPHPSYYLRRGIEIDDIIDGAKAHFNFKPSEVKVKVKRKIILDIETNAETDVEKAKVVVIGVYDHDLKKAIIMWTVEELKQYLEKEQITHIIGYNNIKFDQPILGRFGVDFLPYCNIDMYITIQNKRTSLGLEKLQSNSLAAVLDYLKLGKKLDFDYDILKKEVMTPEEKQKLEEYLKGDIEGTAKLYEYIYNIYSVVEKYLNQNDAYTENYLMITEGRLAYKTICKAKGIPEKMIEGRDDKPEVKGGFVSEPSQVVNRENIYLIDVQSSYPHAMMMGNLHERIQGNGSNHGSFWQRNQMFPDLQGTYRTDKLGPVAETIKDIYHTRKLLKEQKNPGNLGLKILLNTFYGVLASDKFVGVSDQVAGGDVTYMGQTFVKYMRTKLAERKYEIIYSDSVFKETKIVVDDKTLKIEEFWNHLRSVITTNSFEKEIKDISKYNFKTLCLTTKGDKNKNNKHQSRRRINKIIRHKTKKKLYEIITESGKSIIVTEDHSIPVDRGIFTTKEIVVGDKVFTRVSYGRKKGCDLSAMRAKITDKKPVARGKNLKNTISVKNYFENIDAWNKGMTPKEWMKILKRS